MVKFGFLLRRTGRLSLSRELAEKYLGDAPILFEGMHSFGGPLKELIDKERRTDRALRDAMEGKAPLSDTLAYLMDLSLSEELKDDLLVIYAWLYQRVLGVRPPVSVDIPQVLPKLLEERLDELRSHVLMTQLKRMGLV